MSGNNDPAASRAQLRPYYNQDTFNIGYQAVFNPDKGVVDVNGEPIASKLAITAQNRSRLGAGGMDRLASLGVGASIGAGGKYGSQLSFPGLTVSWNDVLSVGKWETLVWHTVLRRYFKNLVQQPFETCKILMQTTAIREGSHGSIGPDHAAAAAAEPESDDDEHQEIDFFPVQKTPEELEDDTEDVAAHWGDRNVAPVRSRDSPDSGKLDIQRLTTWSVINAMRNNDNFGITALWRSNNVSFLYTFCRRGLSLVASRVVSPFYYYYNLNFSTVLGLKILTNFVTEVVLLPLDLYKVKQIVSDDSVGQEDTDASDSDSDSDDDGESGLQWLRRKLLLHNYWGYTLDDKTLRLFALILLKIGCKRFFDNGLEFLIYYWLNFTNVDNKIYLIFLLKFATEFCEFFVKLPIETLFRRYQVDYLLTNTTRKHPKVQRDDLIITPVNVNTSQVWRGLWNGWKVALMSLMCGFGFKVMNNIDDDLEQERF